MNSTIYIRKENQDEWDSIEDKSLWVNSRLGVSSVPSEPKTHPVIAKIAERRAEDPLEQAKQWAAVQNRAEFSGKMKFCDNGHPIPDGRSKCLGKGCKYA